MLVCVGIILGVIDKNIVKLKHFTIKDVSKSGQLGEKLKLVDL